MKKIFVICMAGLLAFVFTSAALALDDEDGISKKNKEWMGKVMLNTRSIGISPAATSTKESKMVAAQEELPFPITDPIFLPDPVFIKPYPGTGVIDKDLKLTPYANDAVVAAKKDLCERLGIDEKKITDFGLKFLGSMATTQWPYPTAYTQYRIGLVYKGVTYIYDGNQVDGYDYSAGAFTHSGYANFTGETIPAEYDAKGNLILNSEDLPGGKEPKENDNSGKLIFYDKDGYYNHRGTVRFSNDMTPAEIYEYLGSVGCEARTIDYTLNIWTFAFDENEDVQKKLKEVAKDKRVEYVLPSLDLDKTFLMPLPGGNGTDEAMDMMIPGNVLTKFNDDMSIENIQELLNEVGAVIESRLGGSSTVSVRFDSLKYTNQEIIDYLQGTGKVAWAESNSIIKGIIPPMPTPVPTPIFRDDGKDLIHYVVTPVSDELLAQAREILGESVATGEDIRTAIPEGMIIEGGATAFYDADGKLVGQHQWDPTRNINEWLKVDATGKLVLISTSTITEPETPVITPSKQSLTDEMQASADEAAKAYADANGIPVGYSGMVTLDGDNFVIGYGHLNPDRITMDVDNGPTFSVYINAKTGKVVSVGVEAPIIVSGDQPVSAEPLAKAKDVSKKTGNEEVIQRKDVEAKVALKGNGKNYTVSTQMADAPKEAGQIQKKR